jgi:hypothetical protein
MYCFKSKSEDHLHQQIEKMKAYVKEEIKFLGPDSIEIQVFFETSQGILFRVLEAGYGLRNILWKHFRLFPQCSYDSRSDIPRKDRKNETVAEEIDQLIFQKNYKVFTIAEGVPFD